MASGADQKPRIVRAEILSIGTELLLGEIVDTDAAFLAGELPKLGINLYWVTQVGDNLGRLVEVLRRALERSDLVLTTGGLGPTDDDVTREAIAETLGERMEVQPELAQHLREFFGRRNLPMPERNLKQATLIPSAQAIPNPRGTAPGWWVEWHGKVLVAMPGPPHEMQRMWQMEVVPRLGPLLTGERIVSRTLKSFGLGEGSVDELISPLSKSPNPSIGTYAKSDGIHLRITAKAKTADIARGMIAPVEARIRELLGERIWGVDDETIEGVVGEMLKARKLNLATMESCTGGLLASTITDIPGSSTYFKGGLITYTNQAKIAWGVDSSLIERHGAVSAEVAADMARAVRQCLDADVGVGVTGVAGPSSLEGRAPGTVHIAIDFKGQRVAVQGNYPFHRAMVKQRSVVAALFQVRKALSLNP